MNLSSLVTLDQPTLSSRCAGETYGESAVVLYSSLAVAPPSSYAVVPFVVPQTSHLILPHPVSPSSSRLPSCFPYSLIVACILLLRPKINRPQLAPLARPDAQAGHERGAGGLQSPPEEVARDGVRVETCNEKMYGVEGECEVEDEFTPRNKEEDEYRTTTR